MDELLKECKKVLNYYDGANDKLCNRGYLVKATKRLLNKLNKLENAQSACCKVEAEGCKVNEKLKHALVNACVIFTQILREDYTNRDLKVDCRKFIDGVKGYLKFNTNYYIKDNYVRKQRRQK